MGAAARSVASPSLTPAALTSGLPGPAPGTAPLTAAPLTAAAAAEVYKLKCAQCHMPDGNSAIEPMSFADGKWKHGNTLPKLAATIRNGVPGTAMLPFKTQLSEPEILALAKYVRAFDKPKSKVPLKTKK